MSRFLNLELEPSSEERLEDKLDQTRGSGRSSAQREKQLANSLHDLDQNRDEPFYMEKAEQAFQSGKYEVALRLYARVLEKRASASEAWLGQVKSLLEVDEPNEADMWAKKALERFPDHQELIAARAVAQVRMGSWSKAKAFSDASLKEKGTTSYVWLVRGEVFLAAGHDKYEHCFRKALAEAQRSSKWFIHLCVGRIYKFYDKFAKALKALREAVSLEPSSPFLWNEQGICQLALKLYGNATFSFQQALELDPGSETAEEGLQIAQNNNTLWGRITGFFSSKS
mgnify:CR=1 FL=1